MEGPSGNSFPSQPLLGKLRRSMIPQKLQKKRVQVVENKVKAKHRSGVTPVLPVRLTSCIFTRPVTRISSLPGSKTMRRRQGEEKLAKPQQLCAFRRLQGHQVEDSKEEQLHPLDRTNSVKRIALGMQAEAKVRCVTNDLHTSPEFISVQPPSSEKKVQGTPELSPPSFCSQGVTMPVALQLSPSFYRQTVTTADIRRQTRRVKKARKKLAAALEADRLARQAEYGGTEQS